MNIYIYMIKHKCHRCAKCATLSFSSTAERRQSSNEAGPRALDMENGCRGIDTCYV